MIANGEEEKGREEEGRQEEGYEEEGGAQEEVTITGPGTSSGDWSSLRRPVPFFSNLAPLIRFEDMKTSPGRETKPSCVRDDHGHEAALIVCGSLRAGTRWWLEVTGQG